MTDIVKAVLDSPWLRTAVMLIGVGVAYGDIKSDLRSLKEGAVAQVEVNRLVLQGHEGRLAATEQLLKEVFERQSARIYLYDEDRKVIADHEQRIDALERTK